MIEQILRDFDHAHGLCSISLRYFNAAGADPDTEIGELHDPETHLLHLVLDAAVGIRPVITVFGDDYDTPHGTCIPDYIHVSDLSDAHVLSLLALENGSKTTAYNLGNRNGFSVREVIEVAQKVTDLSVPFEIGPRRAGDPAQLVGDARRVSDVVNWRPRFDDLGQMVQTAWNWHTKKASITMRKM